MKWASERPGFDTSVHSWKPCPAERFAKLAHGYAATCCDEHGHAGMSMTACKLDHQTTATIYYRPQQYPEHSGVSTPVLMTVATNDGRVITFERIPSQDYPGLPEVTNLAPVGRRVVGGQFEHIAYAFDNKGGGLTLGQPEGRSFIGTRRSRSSAPSLNPDDYNWSALVSTDG